MKINQVHQKRQAFTLIEMIGVLAVIAILAAVLVPKVFAAINNSRVNNAAMSIQTVKTACVDHYSKFGSILGNGTTTYALGAGYDTNLLSEGFLEKPFAVRIGDGSTNNTTIRTVDISAAAFNSGASVDGTVGTGFDLDGSGGNRVTGSTMVEAVISGVDINDAKDLNDRIDGTTLGSATPTALDHKGRVKYEAPVGGGTNTTTVYVYLTHR